jgi:hypothetical protein
VVKSFLLQQPPVRAALAERSERATMALSAGWVWRMGAAVGQE